LRNKELSGFVEAFSGKFQVFRRKGEGLDEFRLKILK
jgi:hypothetical protein